MKVYSGKKLKNTPFFLLLLLICLLPSFTQASSSNLIIHFIDVGHGDAILIQTDGKNLLLDSGDYNIGDTVPVYLRKVGIKRLDLVIASHPHSDHIGGMLDVFKLYPPALYVDNGEIYDNPSYEPLMQYLVRKQIPYAVGRKGNSIPFVDGTKIIVTSPSALGKDINENSLSFVLTYGSLKFFFPGDCETCDADADVVKLAHHGSKGAATRALLSGTKPETVIISVGKDNGRNLPASSTIKALDKAGIAIHRTDQEGTIILHSDGSQYWFE